MPEVAQVENPEYQTMREIMKDYWGNWLLMSHITEEPSGGTVRFYAKNREGMLALVMEMDKDPEYFGECDIRYVGPNNSLGGLFNITSSEISFKI